MEIEIPGSSRSFYPFADFYLMNIGLIDNEYYVQVVPEENYSNCIEFDLSAIPPNAKIKSAELKYELRKLNLTGYCSFTNIIVESRSLAKPENILAYLQKLSEFRKMHINFLMEVVASTFTTSGPVDEGTKSARAAYSDVRLVVTYESDDSTVNYGKDGKWEKCKVFYGTPDGWKECKAHYGTPDGWKEVK